MESELNNHFSMCLSPCFSFLFFSFLFFSFLFVSFLCIKSLNAPVDLINSFQDSPDRMIHWDYDHPQARNLLEKYKPYLFLSPDSYKPINFYSDYLPQCVLKSISSPKTIIQPNVTANILNIIKNRRDYYLEYLPSVPEALAQDISRLTPTFYGRVYEDTLATSRGTMRFLFLKYSFVAAYSGLPSQIVPWKNNILSVLGDVRGWHQMDHGSIYIILNAQNEKPVGILLSQHNHHRTYIIGQDFQWPPDNRVRIALSKFSNEPYLVDDTMPSFLMPVPSNPFHAEFLFNILNKVPFIGGYDFIMTPHDGAQKINMILEYIPLNNPLYTAEMSLGRKKRLFGLSFWWIPEGPPGIDCFSLTKPKNLADLTSFWYINIHDKYFLALFKKQNRVFSKINMKQLLEYQNESFYNTIQRLQ